MAVIAMERGTEAAAVGVGAVCTPAPAIRQIRASLAARRTRYARLLAPRSCRSGYRLGLAGRPLGAAGAVGDRVADVAHLPGAADVWQHVEGLRLPPREAETLERLAPPTAD